MIKRSIKQEDIIFVNIYAPKNTVSRYIRRILTDLKGEIDSNTIIVRDFNTPLTSMDISFRQKFNKEIILNDMINQMTLKDIYIEPFIPK